jgi:two-component system sensor histidine kinase RegB
MRQERQIALPWLARLRWIAVLGQIVAICLSMIWLDLRLPLQWIALPVSITILSNIAIQLIGRTSEPPDWVVPGILLLDVLLLTVLLYFTGGTENPFSILYAIHVAMAVVVLGAVWAWSIVALSGVCCAIVFIWNRPLNPPLPVRVLQFGQWSSLVLVSVLIAYFVGRVTRSLRLREEELAAASERARRGDHLASLTTLAAGAAHELGTPLSTIALVAKEMERSLQRGDSIEELSEDAKLIRHEVDRCRSILDRMRVDVVGDSMQRPSVATFDELTEQLRIDLRPTESPRLVVESTERGDHAIWRSNVLRRVIGVLLRNAFDASPAGATVTLIYRHNPTNSAFEVADSGSGMSEQVLRRAGEPFFTTKNPGEGMGLGLFLVRLVAETYGGRFELNSTPGAGTHSILNLPNPPMERINHADSQTQDAGGGR